MSSLASEHNVSFAVEATAGDARTGTLSVGSRTMDTPNLFPVINFYGGGRKESLFGGSTHRTVKELINGDSRVAGVDCSHLFPGAMLSVGSLTDYGIPRSTLDEYLAEPVSERPEFHGFDGMLFTDSGGFKNLQQGGLDGSDFEIELDQQKVFEIQMALGGDVLVNLDVPIEPDDTDAERRRKARETAENAIEFLRLANSSNFQGAKYLTVHGYYYSMIDSFFEELKDVFGTIRIRDHFDGIALGSLVPKKDDRETLIDAVTGCREVMAKYDLDDLPLHVLGISSSAMPLLAAIGADTFDSSSYIHSAINGKYSTNLTETIPVDEAEFTQCNCPVCSSPELRRRMNGDTEFRKDQMGPVAVHNMYIQQIELQRIRECIRRDGTQPLIKYIENTVGRIDKTRQFAHQVVNQSLGGYF